MNSDNLVKHKSGLDKIPDSILIIPTFVVLVWGIIGGQLFDDFVIYFSIPMLLLIATYIQRNVPEFLNGFRWYTVRRMLFLVMFWVMFFCTFGMAVGLVTGERMFPEQSVFVDITMVVGYLMTAILFYRYACYLTALEKSALPESGIEDS